MVKEIDGLTLSGGRLSLDFINTVHSYTDGIMDDYWKDAASLVAWGRKLDLLTPKNARSLHEAIIKKEAAMLRLMRETRQLLYSIFHSMSKGQKPSQAELDQFYQAYHRALANQRISYDNETIREEWQLAGDDIHQIIAPVLKDAYQLLISEQIHRVGECPTCGWIFLDSTKNGKRRWCSMAACGGNAKALDWYYRNKKNEQKN